MVQKELNMFQLDSVRAIVKVGIVIDIDRYTEYEYFVYDYSEGNIPKIEKIDPYLVYQIYKSFCKEDNNKSRKIEFWKFIWELTPGGKEAINAAIQSLHESAMDNYVGGK